MSRPRITNSPVILSPSTRCAGLCHPERSSEAQRRSEVEGRSQSALVSQKAPVKIYYVYMVLCADHSFYTGITNNAEYRVNQHNYGEDPGCYTFKRRPVTLVHVSDFSNVDDAIRWEKQLKGWSRAKKKALAAGNWAAIHELARRKSK
jgi:putative endonuclease